MKPAAGSWNQTEFESFISRRAKPISPGFCLFVPTDLLLLSWTCLPRGSSVAPFSSRLFLSPILTLCLSIYAGPFLPHGLPLSTADCEPLPRVPLFWYSFLFELSSVCLSFAPYNLQYSSFHLSLESLEHLLSFSVNKHTPKRTQTNKHTHTHTRYEVIPLHVVNV